RVDIEVAALVLLQLTKQLVQRVTLGLGHAERIQEAGHLTLGDLNVGGTVLPVGSGANVVERKAGHDRCGPLNGDDQGMRTMTAPRKGRPAPRGSASLGAGHDRVRIQRRSPAAYPGTPSRHLRARAA